VLQEKGLCCNIMTGYQNVDNGQQADTYTGWPLQKISQDTFKIV